uniref:Uncharacterized protein n=1 Tax=Knipowitschia caucasica TaxID=637954 RepID=A0AAV2JG28_KNICA
MKQSAVCKSLKSENMPQAEDQIQGWSRTTDHRDQSSTTNRTVADKKGPGSASEHDSTAHDEEWLKIPLRYRHQWICYMGSRCGGVEGVRGGLLTCLATVKAARYADTSPQSPR